MAIIRSLLSFILQRKQNQKKVQVKINKLEHHQQLCFVLVKVKKLNSCVIINLLQTERIFMSLLCVSTPEALTPVAIDKL